MTDSNQHPDRPAPKAPLETSFAARTVKVGDLLVCKVVKITGNVAFVDYGGRSEGYIELSELRDETGQLAYNEGDEFQEAEVINTRGAIQLSHKKAQVGRIRERLQQAWKAEEAVEGRIVGVNKGGFEVRIDGVRAFCPLSQLHEHFPREPAREVGNTYEFRITEFTDGKSLVVSRRALLEVRKREMRETIGERIRAGERLQGTVTQVRDFGAFIDLGDGVEGLVHVSEISHDRVAHPSDRLKPGDAVEVEVLKVDAEKGRVSLSMRALESDPWRDFVATLKPGQTLSGTVERLQPFGAFITLAPGVDGLIHISGLAVGRRIESPDEVLTVGTTIEVVVEKIDRQRQRIGLVMPEVYEARNPAGVTVEKGQVLKGRVVRIEQYGVFVEVAPKVVGLVPNAEMDTERNADHHKLFPIGTEVEVKVIDIEPERNRIRLSRKALKTNEEDQAYAAYRSNQQKTPKSLGTFGDLLKDFLNKQ